MADYEFTSVKQLQLDLEDAIKGSSDDGTKKALKKEKKMNFNWITKIDLQKVLVHS